MKIIKHPATVIIAGIFLWWLFFYPAETPKSDSADHGLEKHSNETVWTCSMHPQIQSKEEGDCPLCGMDLIPLDKGTDKLPANQILISPDEIYNSGIKTIKVEERIVTKEISLQGYSAIDRSSEKKQSVHFNGRITETYINYSGQEIHKNDIIAQIYSPELISAQKEFIESIKLNSESIYNSTKRKLELLNISASDIDMIEKNKSVIEFFNIKSDFDGIVDEINIVEGDYVLKGKTLYSLYSLDNIWFEFEIYEKDLSFVNKNDKVIIKTHNDRNKIEGVVDFIQPRNDKSSTSTLLRVIVANKNKNLRPGIYADATISSKLPDKKIVVPQSSILWTGQRSIAYVNIDSSIFEMRNVTLGEEAGDYYVIEEGLEVGENIVYKALFTLDAAAQLQGKSSMMNSGSQSTRINISDDKVKAYSTRLLALYLELKDQLVGSNNLQAVSIAENINQLEYNFSQNFIGSKNGQIYLELTNKIKRYSGEITNTSNLDEQREIFENISNSVIDLVEIFTMGSKLYVQHCPMAFDNKGADWVSKSNEILNPYFGQSMLRCGSVIKEF